MTKKEYLKSKGFYRNCWGDYLKEDFDYCQCISIDEDHPYIKVICFAGIYSDNDIKNLQIVFNNLKQIQEECMKLPTYKRKKDINNH